MRLIASLIRRVLLPVACLSAASLHAESVKVYVLAGQSNMEGKVQKILMDHQATDSKTSELFKHLRKDNDWIVRDDVMIKSLSLRRCVPSSQLRLAQGQWFPGSVFQNHRVLQHSQLRARNQAHAQLRTPRTGPRLPQPSSWQ